MPERSGNQDNNTEEKTIWCDEHLNVFKDEFISVQL